MDDVTWDKVLHSAELAAGFAGLILQLKREERSSRDALCKIALVDAENLVRDGRYTEAQAHFQKALAILTDKKIRVPLHPSEGGGVLSPAYLSFTMDECITAMTCCNGLSHCFFELKQWEKSLEWAQEIDILHRNRRYSDKPLFEWEIYHPTPNNLEFNRLRLMGMTLAADVYRLLGNTGSAAHLRNAAMNLVKSLPSAVEQSAMRREVVSVSQVVSSLQHRHPDTSVYRHHQTAGDDLQLLGSWQKLEVRRRLPSRMAHSGFIWNSKFYVACGQRSGTFEVYQDLWSLDLRRLDGWRRLPSPTEGVYMNCPMAVCAGKAYIFRGLRTLDVFDLARERWGRLPTTFLTPAGARARWPWHTSLKDHAMVAVRGRLYVFGGACDSLLGNNFFACLDLSARTWEHLSGTPDAEPYVPSYACPAPRKHCAMWADKHETRIFLMYGMPDRHAAGMRNGGTRQEDVEGHSQEDCWVWIIAERRWQRERISGNWPCPRTEMSMCYNPKLEQTVMFGGYSPALPYYIEGSDTCFGYSYFADTFALEHAANGGAGVWRHVLTASFPTYRAQGLLAADADTGRMYLFGGYTNTQWVPAGDHEVTRSYGDVWELRIDVPGGHFAEVDREDERRTALAGPWQTCFSCGSIGMWKKCGGTCEGRVFFCNPQCLRRGWQEHREKHNCRKES